MKSKLINRLDTNSLDSLPSFLKGSSSPRLVFRASVDDSRGIDGIHTHPYVQLWYAKSGKYRHFFQKKEYELGPGSLLIVPPNYPHALDTRYDSSLFRLEFSDSFISSISDDETKRSLFNLLFLEPVLSFSNKIEPYHYFSSETAGRLEEIFSELCTEYEKKDDFSSMFVRGELVRMFAIIAREYNITGHDKALNSYRDSLESAITYINSHFTEKLYLPDICKIAMLSRNSFCYLFKQLMGIPFSKYVQYLRVLRAKELLASTDRTQYDIALSCGFFDSSSFHKTFKEFSGMLPGQYREQNRKQ